MKIQYTVMIVALMAMLIAMPLVVATNQSVVNLTSSSVNTSITTQNLSEEDVTATRIGWEKIKIWFTFSQEKKARLEMDLANLRLIQARVAAKNNNSEAMNRALVAHQTIIDRLQERLTRLSGQNVSNNDTTGLQNSIIEHQNRITQLQNMMNNSNLTEEQVLRIQARISQAEDVTDRLQEIQDKREEIRQNREDIRDLREQNNDEREQRRDFREEELRNKNRSLEKPINATTNTTI
jgi:uncharacterized coiled-coil protein SlyX